MTSNILVNTQTSSLSCEPKSLQPVSNPSEQKTTRIKSAAKRCFKSLASSWEYVNKGVGLTRHTINLIINSGSWIKNRHQRIYQILKNTTLYIKFFAIISIPLAIAKIPSQIQDFKNSIVLKDREGSFLAGLSISTMFVGLFESITSFVNTTLEVLTRSPIKGFTLIGAPIGLALSGINSFNKCYHIYHLSKFNLDLEKKVLNKIEKETVASKIGEVVSPFLKEHLGSDETQTPLKQSRKFKARVLERHTNKAIVGKLSEISALMQQMEPLTTAQTATIVHTFKDIKKDLKVEKLYLKGSFLTGIISGIALATFYLSNPILPFALMATSALGQIGLKIYRDKKNQNK